MKLALIRRRQSATGGAELYLDRLVGALVERGHEVHVLAEHWPTARAGVSVRSLAVAGGRAFRPLRFAEAVQRALSEERFDCVFSLERTVGQDVYRAGDGVHAAWLERRREFAPWWRRWLVGRGAFHRTMLALEQATFDPARTGRVIVNSDMVRREVRARFGFPEERMHLVRNGVEVERFRRAEGKGLRARLGWGPDEYVLLFVGSGWERKGLSFLLRALRDPALASVRLLVVGKGTPPAGTPAKVVFAGPMKEVEAAYAAADLFVFLPIYEPSANVCLEALASGLPVVTTRYDGASEWVREGVNGTVLEDPRDTARVVGAIEEWRGRRGARVGLDRAWALDRNVEETLAVLERAALERAARERGA